jgi:hypothetical protein
VRHEEIRMSIKTMLAMACAALLSASAVSVLAQDTSTANEKRAQGCCLPACARHGSAKDGSGAMDGSGATHGSAAKDGSGRMRCSLTGRIMDTCCCTEKEGKLHCTLADKDVESCCCVPVTDDTEESDEAQHSGDEAQK